MQQTIAAGVNIVIVAAMVAAPLSVIAQSDAGVGSCGGFVPCGCDTAEYTKMDDGSWNRTSDAKSGEVEPPEQCGFNDLRTLTQNVLDWLVTISISLAALMFAYAGWLYLSAQGDTNQVQQAHKVFTNVGIGLVLVIGAWVIVYTVASAVLEDHYFNDFLSS